MDKNTVNREGAQPGNQNARKTPEPRSRIVMDVPRSQKAAYVRAANQEGKNLTVWITDVLDLHLAGNSVDSKPNSG